MITIHIRLKRLIISIRRLIKVHVIKQLAWQGGTHVANRCIALASEPCSIACAPFWGTFRGHCHHLLWYHCHPIFIPLLHGLSTSTAAGRRQCWIMLDHLMVIIVLVIISCWSSAPRCAARPHIGPKDHGKSQRHVKRNPASVGHIGHARWHTSRWSAHALLDTGS